MVTLTVHVKVIPKHFVTPSLVVNNGLKTLEFLSIAIHLTPPQISVSPKITLISSAPHASKMFSTPITTFDEVFVQLEVAVETCIQFMNNFEPMMTTNIIHVEETMNEPIKGTKTYV